MAGVPNAVRLAASEGQRRAFVAAARQSRLLVSAPDCAVVGVAWGRVLAARTTRAVAVRSGGRDVAVERVGAACCSGAERVLAAWEHLELPRVVVRLPRDAEHGADERIARS